MKNSTQWSNLYSVASKYSIQVFNSKTKQLLHVVGVALVICLLAAIGLFQVNMVLVQYIVLPALIVVIAAANFVYSKNKNVALDSSLPIFTLEIDDRGDVVFDGCNFNLHLNSRISILGCWLVLENSSMPKTELAKLLIFKDSVSTQSYSRLCRAINRTANVNENEVSA